MQADNCEGGQELSQTKAAVKSDDAEVPVDYWNDCMQLLSWGIHMDESIHQAKLSLLEELLSPKLLMVVASSLMLSPRLA